MHKIYCVIGRSASGKSSLTREVANQLGLKVLKSYTTRPKRESELNESDHIHISSEEVSNFSDDIVAYTKIGEYEYFCTKQQLLESDFYVVDPVGYYSLKEKSRELGIKIESIYISVPRRILYQRAIDRGDSIEAYSKRTEDENVQFTKFANSNDMRFVILNDGTFEESVDKFMRIMAKEGYKKKK